MPLNYTHTTFAQAKTQLAALLNDTGKAFYSDAELGVYLTEALRFWGAATGYWRDRGTFTTSTASGSPPTQDNPWYDLPTFLPTFRGYNVTDAQVVNSIQYSLLEPAAIPWTGSTQFQLSDILNALQRRRDQFLLETFTVLTHSSTPMNAPPISRYVLADNVIGVRRTAWKSSLGVWAHLPRSDEWFMLSYYSTPWPEQANPVPQVYSTAVTPPLTIQLAPPPDDKGTLDLLTVNAGATLTGLGVLMGIPDDFTWVVKFGALADLLGEDGPAKDPLRAMYCQQRWLQGIQIAKSAVSVLFLYVNNVPQYIESLASVDSGRPLWQNYSGNPPFMAGMAGLNLLALIDPPAGQFSITVDLVTNALIPANDAAFVQIGREELAAVIGYAQHLAVFKCAGAEFVATQKHLDRILTLASTYNKKLQAQTQTSLTNRAQQENYRRPAMIQGVMA